MRHRAFALALALTTTLALGAAPATAERLKVIATFSILGDMTEAVGGDRVEVTTLIGAEGDPHVFEPTPRHAGLVADADVIVANGLGFEGWLDRLVAASGFEGTVVTASAAVVPLPAHTHDHEGHGGQDHVGAPDPHAWQDLMNGALYAQTIATGLAAADPEGAAAYDANVEAYARELSDLAMAAKDRFAALPEDRRTVLTSHDAFSYFAHAYGLTFLAPQGVSTESEPSARDVAALIRHIRDAGVDAVFLESVTDNRMIEQIAQETGVAVGGELFTDALSGPEGTGSTYLAMMRHNVDAVATALAAER